MPPRHGEIPALVVHLDAALAVASWRELSPNQDVNATPAWANLGVGVQLFYDLLSPALYLASVGVQAAVQVHAAERVVLAEHEAYASVTVLSVRLYGFGVAGPGLRVSGAGFLTSERGVRHFGGFAVAPLDAPAQPLSEVSYVACLYYHV